MKKRMLTAGLLSIAIVAFISGYSKYTSAEYGDIVINSKAEKTGINPVVFPHWFHRIRFKCKVCHEDIFLLKAGGNDINMLKIMKGQYCGKCHNGRIAWSPLYCDRCHSGKKSGKVKAKYRELEQDPTIVK